MKTAESFYVNIERYISIDVRISFALHRSIISSRCPEIFIFVDDERYFHMPTERRKAPPSNCGVTPPHRTRIQQPSSPALHPQITAHLSPILDCSTQKLPCSSLFSGDIDWKER
jgi:hypothetical protein